MNGPRDCIAPDFRADPRSAMQSRGPFKVFEILVWNSYGDGP
jgi:hypothetical protein